ncbi:MULTISPECIES: thiamine phosphate synthase [unclassified Xanthobacter]|uniref:thiamine phosphate synthase n=1 Tax=unclassified Xanthobacter TaxID=2623496 RepID=UPI001F1795A9|nr:MULTISPECIES: thiamine phosphate synthase [unclassified Xanthobacter]
MSQSADPIRARLMLILSSALPPGEAAARVAAGDVAAVVVRGGAAVPDAARLRALAQPLQKADCAVLLEDHADTAKAAGLDGMHVEDATSLPAAVKRLKPDAIVGAGGLTGRHEAMEAGESGADYVMFGSLDGSDFARACALVAWWSPLFEVPCAAVARSLDEVEALARAGADFIALGAEWTGGVDGIATIAAAQAIIDSTAADPAAGPA